SFRQKNLVSPSFRLVYSDLPEILHIRSSGLFFTSVGTHLHTLSSTTAESRVLPSDCDFLAHRLYPVFCILITKHFFNKVSLLRCRVGIVCFDCGISNIKTDPGRRRTSPFERLATRPTIFSRQSWPLPL